MGKRGRRWPRATIVPTNPFDFPVLDVHRPLVVARSVTPSKVFTDLVVALGLPEDEVRFVISDVVDDPEVTPEALTEDQLAHLGPALLRSIDAAADLPEAERRAAHQRVASLLRAVAHK